MDLDLVDRRRLSATLGDSLLFLREWLRFCRRPELACLAFCGVLRLLLLLLFLDLLFLAVDDFRLDPVRLTLRLEYAEDFPGEAWPVFLGRRWVGATLTLKPWARLILDCLIPFRSAFLTQHAGGGAWSGQWDASTVRILDTLEP